CPAAAPPLFANRTRTWRTQTLQSEELQHDSCITSGKYLETETSVDSACNVLSDRHFSRARDTAMGGHCSDVEQATQPTRQDRGRSEMGDRMLNRVPALEPRHVNLVN